MVKLFCAIVGVAGSAFSVRVDESDSVDDLKDAIKEKKMYQFPADKLQLFLAKKDKGRGAWLKSKDLLRMRKGEIPNEVESRYMKEELEDPTDKICSKFPSTIPDGTIHVLVVVPEQGTSAPIVSDGGVFDRCSDPFFSKFQTVDEVNSWLQFSALLPLTERQTLYIRSSYKSIAAQALTKVDPNRRKYAVITGTPGIGKRGEFLL
ncbi:hypothetical protein PC117_g19241 [Phytophthora cactorum]|uniref:Crinkler effector protein N-terminal domain-containing protein n=2 Tax=Phytophthora cactorum TaxID=29920 RepID=A0A8T1BYR8_9STRA|nr:hypothetical protein PC117_g19241 [Phytophthora cactorum]